MGPTIIENGMNSMKVALENAGTKGYNLLDMMILSVLEGSMPKKYIGN